MSDLTEFLAARLDEDEQAASEAVAGPWTASGGYITGGEPPNDGDFGEVHILPYAPNEYDPDEKTAAHIARHDPVRVLADIAAKRRIIAEAFAYAAKVDGEWGCCHSADRIEAGECPDIDPDEIELLRLLAAPYAAHQDYREAWRV